MFFFVKRDGDFYFKSLLYNWSKRFKSMFVYSKVKRHKENPRHVEVLHRELLRVMGWSHIPLPCVAASLPLQFGTGHEANIYIYNCLFSILNVN
jgi:hypothetical protein